MTRTWPCAHHPGRVHTDGPCECFRGGPAPGWPTACPTCGRPFVVDSLATDCQAAGHLPAQGDQ